MKNKMDTDTLFDKIINERGVYSRLGVSEATVRQLRFNHSAGKVTIDRMHQIIELYGYEIRTPTIWRKKK